VLSVTIDSPDKEYEYSELPHGSIRLLHLLPHKENGAPIQCQLFDYPIQKTGEGPCLYEALSYCWGSSHKPRRISIGDRYLPVTESLYAALLRLRDRFIGRVIWADAICINQGDVGERGQQVQSMAEIYYKANRVVVWLGEARDDDRDAFEAILATGREPTTPPGDKQEAVHALLNRPWFRRIWVRRAMVLSSGLSGSTNKCCATGASGSSRSSLYQHHVWLCGD
jgi:hypothetical protein